MNGDARRIILADDHEVIRDGLRASLSTCPQWIVVGEAADGTAALELVRAERPDIVILDFAMPGLDGLELTRAIKREMPEIEVLIFTKHERYDVLADLLQAGARGYVLKSDSARHLLDAVEALAEARPYFSERISKVLLQRFLDASQRGQAVAALTPREQDIVLLVAQGESNRSIAEKLDLSVKTVETHRSAVMHKLDLRTLADLVRYAVRNGIVGV